MNFNYNAVCTLLIEKASKNSYNSNFQMCLELSAKIIMKKVMPMFEAYKQIKNMYRWYRTNKHDLHDMHQYQRKKVCKTNCSKKGEYFNIYSQQPFKYPYRD